MVTLLPLHSSNTAKRLRMAPNVFLRLFSSIPEEGVHGHSLIPEKFLLFAKVHLTVWLSLWLSYFLKGTPCLYSPNLITTISRHIHKVVPLEPRGYHRYWNLLSQFEITSVLIEQHSLVVAKGHPCTTQTCQSGIGKK